MIMCQYLIAEFNLKQGTGDGLTSEQADADKRWHNTLHGIAVEEMLDLALVANLVTGIGAAPTFGRPNFPQRSGPERARPRRSTHAEALDAAGRCISSAR
jgi:hypothetical protein